jgi:hypothetical protein
MELTTSLLRLCAVALLTFPAATVPAETPKLTGWFACEKCTAPRAANGDLRPSNPVCAKQCIDKGSEAVFISEQGKELFKVRNHASVKDDIGYKVEVTGEIDRTAKTISIRSVTKLAEEGASCVRPRPKGKSSER